jgi:hypothetical protein
MALQSAAATVATVASQNQPLELTPQAVGSELRFLLKGQKELDARITSLKEQATALIASGKQIPYFALEQGRGRDKWTVPTAELKVLGELFDCEIVKEELITPKQAIEKGIPEDIVKEYYETPRGSLKITEVTDKQMRKLFQEKK